MRGSLWAEMKEDNDEGEAVLKEVKAEAEKDIISQIEQQQTDYLLDLMNK
jgi:hypothetical protein